LNLSHPEYATTWRLEHAEEIASKRFEKTAKRLADNADYFIANGQFTPLKLDEAAAVANRIIFRTVIGDLGTLARILLCSLAVVYIGTTKRLLEEEATRFLERRGSNTPEGKNYKGGRNRPVLVLADGSPMKRSYAVGEGGFCSQCVYQSSLLLDVTAVEAAMQRKLHFLNLGSQRLWRCVAMGRKSNKSDVEGKEIYKVFVTYSTRVTEFLDSGEWIIQGGAPPTADGGARGEKRQRRN